MSVKLVTDRNDPKLKEGQKNVVGQHSVYLVLSDEELAKGFVRPYRNKYVHVGRSICAKTVGGRYKNLGAPRNICSLPYEHEGKCDGPFIQFVSQFEQSQLLRSHRRGGCGVETIMGQKLSETYARQPDFYGATFCVGCNRHLPVGEFMWSQDDEIVGS